MSMSSVSNSASTLPRRHATWAVLMLLGCLVASLVGVTSASEYFTSPLLGATACNEPCNAGKCFYEGCEEVPASCPGGRCLFVDCVNASCSGGACTFLHCTDPSCAGGRCEFFEPKNTLLDGFCNGGACRVDGHDASSSLRDQLAF